MSSTKTNRKTTLEHQAQIEKMQRHVTESCDRECRESNREWLKRLQENRQGEPSPKSLK